MPAIHYRYRGRRPQIEECYALVPIAAARQVIEEASGWLGVALPARFATGLAFRARRCYAHSESFRVKIRRPGDAGRDLLYVFMRHWLAARLRTERPALYDRLPKEYSCGAPLLPPPLPVAGGVRLGRHHPTGAYSPPVRFPLVNCTELSLDARLLAFG